MYDPFAPLDPSGASWSSGLNGGYGFGGVTGWSNLGLPVPNDLLTLSRLSGYGGPDPSTPAYSYYLALQQGAPFGGYASTPAQTYYQARQQEALGSSAMSDPFGGQTAGYLGDGGGFSNMYAPYGSSPSDANGGSSSGLGNTPYFFTDAHSHHGPGAAAAPAASSGIKSGSWQFQQFPGAPAIANPAAGSTMPVAQASPFGNAAIAKSPSTVIGPGTNRDQQFIGPSRPTPGHAGISPPPPLFSDAALAQWRNTPVRPDESGHETNVPKAAANQLYDYSNSALGVLFAPGNAAVGAVTHDPALQAQASHDLSTGLPVVTGGGLLRMLQNSADPVGDLTRWVHNNPTDAIASGLIGAALHGVARTPGEAALQAAARDVNSKYGAGAIVDRQDSTSTRGKPGPIAPPGSTVVSGAASANAGAASVGGAISVHPFWQGQVDGFNAMATRAEAANNTAAAARYRAMARKYAQFAGRYGWGAPKVQDYGTKSYQFIADGYDDSVDKAFRDQGWKPVYQSGGSVKYYSPNTLGPEVAGHNSHASPPASGGVERPYLLVGDIPYNLAPTLPGYEFHHLEAPLGGDRTGYENATTMAVRNDNSGGKVPGAVNMHTGTAALHGTLSRFIGDEVRSNPQYDGLNDTEALRIFNSLPLEQRSVIFKRYWAPLGKHY